MNQQQAHDLARINAAQLKFIPLAADIVWQDAGIDGLQQFLQQQLLIYFDVAQTHVGRDAALAMLRSVEQTTARQLS